MRFLAQWSAVEETEVNALLNISNFPWAECGIKEERVMYIADSLSLSRSKRNTGKHRFEFELVTVEMEMSEGREVMAELSGAVDDILEFVHPRLSFSRGVIPNSDITIFGSHNAGAKEVTLTSDQPWQLRAGDYINLPNDTKVFTVAKTTALQIGNQTVKLANPVRYPLTDGGVVTTNNVTWQLESNGVIEVNTEASDNQDMQLTLVAVERI